MQLSIVIVNYNGHELLKKCLLSIFNTIKSVSFEVIVVDNASTDLSLELTTVFPEVQWVSNSENRGFSTANNQGAAEAKGDYLLLLNNDTEILNDKFSQALAMFSDQNIGMLGLALFNLDRSPQAQGSIFSRAFWTSTEPIEVDFVIGAAMLLPTSLYKQLGGFDENFRFYNEDVDLCKRIKQLKKIVFYPRQRIQHAGGTGKKYLSPFAVREGYIGGLYFFKKHYGDRLLPLYRFAMVIDIVVKVILVTLRRLLDKNESVGHMQKAYLQILRWVVRIDEKIER